MATDVKDVGRLQFAKDPNIDERAHWVVIRLHDYLYRDRELPEIQELLNTHLPFIFGHVQNRGFNDVNRHHSQKKIRSADPHHQNPWSDVCAAGCKTRPSNV